VPKAPAPTPADLGLETPPARMNPLLLAFVVLTSLAAIGLVGASLALEGTPDPRPFLQKLLE
jgi:hypothetical protein